MRTGLLILFGLIATLDLFGFEDYYYTTKAKSGDGVYSILRRYELDDEPCNFQKFYELNDLKKNATLIVGKEYVLPILIVKYNGKSIRTTIGIDDWERAVDIKNYNESIKAKGLRKTHYVDSRILWVPHHLADCQSTGEVKAKTQATVKTQANSNKKITTSKTKKISKTTTKEFDIFGSKHKSVTIKDNSLKGKVYYIVSGHGGIDPGTQCLDCKHTLCEDEYAYDVSLRLAKSLLEKGATVHVIIRDNDGIRDDKFLACDTDEVCLGGNKVAAAQKTRLAQRTHIINDLYKKHQKQGIKEQYALFLHIDSNIKSKRMDVYFFHHEKSKSGKKLAGTLQNTFKDKYAEHQANRGYNGSIRTKNLYVVRNTTPPAILIELGNIKNTSDQKRIMLPGNRQALADWIAEGLQAHKK